MSLIVVLLNGTAVAVLVGISIRTLTTECKSICLTGSATLCLGVAGPVGGLTKSVLCFLRPCFSVMKVQSCASITSLKGLCLAALAHVARPEVTVHLVTLHFHPLSTYHSLKWAHLSNVRLPTRVGAV